LLSSTAEIFRRTSRLFNNVEELKRLALDSSVCSREISCRKAEKDCLSYSGANLRNLNEFKVRESCGNVLFRAGLQEYLQGRVVDKKFSKNTLSGKLDERGKKSESGNDPVIFESDVTIEGSSKLRFFGNCQCALAKEGSLCAHMVALMIAWVKNPREFENQAREDEFDLVKSRVMRSLEELTGCIENGSSRGADLEILQKTYSRLNRWADDVEEATYDRSDAQILMREFSKTMNSVSFAMLSEFERKYKIRAVDIYNKATVTTFARMLDLFAESSSPRKFDESMKIKSKKRLETSTSARRTSSPSRSWDVLVESFARGR
jgi:hypothetical protein